MKLRKKNLFVPPGDERDVKEFHFLVKKALMVQHCFWSVIRLSNQFNLAAKSIINGTFYIKVH